MSIPRDVAGHVLGMRWADLPDGAQRAMAAFLLDTLAVGIAGRSAWLADQVLAVAQAWGGPDGVPNASVLGGGGRLPAGAAAYVNGFQIHCQEYDCVHEPAVVHPMAVIGAALTAEAEARSVPGSEYLAALVGAVDVAAGLGVAATGPIRFFRPATAGLFGATLGIARLRGFDETRALDALGYALAQAAGTMQAHVEGKPTLPIQIAGAARAAIVANDLAEAGLPGPHHVFDGPFGYLPLFEERFDLDLLSDGLQPGRRIQEVSYKPFPTGRAAQGGLVLMGELAAQGVDPDAVQSIELTAPPLIERLVGRPAHADMSVNYGRLCFAYLGAVTLRHGPVGLLDFSPGALGDRQTLALAEKIRVVSDGSEDPAAFTPQVLEARLSDGRTVSARAEALYGSPAFPMTPDDIAAKRAACLSFGFGAAQPERDAALVEAVADLAGSDDAGALARLAAGAKLT